WQRRRGDSRLRKIKEAEDAEETDPSAVELSQRLLSAELHGFSVLSADATRGIPARSFVMATSLHPGASRRRETCSAESWPSSSTRIPPGFSSATACAISGA